MTDSTAINIKDEKPGARDTRLDLDQDRFLSYYRSKAPVRGNSVCVKI
jgi:hypothetical protein